MIKELLLRRQRIFDQSGFLTSFFNIKKLVIIILMVTVVVSLFQAVIVVN